ncbi:AmmeMemoRadiSam system protein B [Bifidobacterium simiarum]|uniref:AmmeMemoRadiSam system protein B n=1 Tax=Bifidobacterium simiarum TaxID=2045441 RepID=UPI001BDD30C1|nr:AmmeMemoRadiSam system protein B [Bifidobacterium simiarum]MBT1166392.1 AmmeMemoRadiSam system protein B [Bifidobacterium simiarum]
MTFTDRIRPAAVAGTFYPDDSRALRAMIARQLDYARSLLASGALSHLPEGAPKAVIVPHAGYVYSGTTAALAYALLERGRGTIRRAVIVGPTHRVAVRGVAMCRATAFETPLGVVPIDVAGEAKAFGYAAGAAGAAGAGSAVDAGPQAFLNLPNNTRASSSAPAPALLLNDPTHAREHAVEVQIPFLQTVLGDGLEIIPLNAGDATPREVGDVLRALWGGSETVIVISSDLSHYHPNGYARMLDDETIGRIAGLDLPIHPNRACGAYPVNGLLDVCRERTGALDLRFLGCSTSGDDGVVTLADDERPPMARPDDPVVGYASFAVWQSSDPSDAAATGSDTTDANTSGRSPDPALDDRGPVLIGLARAAIRERLGLDGGASARDALAAAVADHPWLDEPGASFVTLTEHGRLRGCIGTLQTHQSLGRDVAEHAVDAAMRDPRFMPVTAMEYPLLDVEISVLSEPEPMAVRSRAELERTLRPGRDGLIISDGCHRATFLPQVWDELPDPSDFVGHLLAKAGLPAGYGWNDGEISCSRYTVTAYQESPGETPQTSRTPRPERETGGRS